MTTEKSQSTKKRQFEGTVVSVAENKTIHVRVDSKKIHPKYRKQYTTSSKYAIHDANNDAKVGDIVRFEECRPLSKTKKWKMVEILEKSN